MWVSAFTRESGRLRFHGMHYLAEFYLPGRDADLAGLARRARATAEQASRAGPAVRFVQAIHAPLDESCFAIYEADSPAAITAAGGLAGIAFDRIVEIAINNAGGDTGSG